MIRDLTKDNFRPKRVVVIIINYKN